MHVLKTKKVQAKRNVRYHQRLMFDILVRVASFRVQVKGAVFRMNTKSRKTITLDKKFYFEPNAA